MLLNAEKLSQIQSASYIFLSAGIAAFFEFYGASFITKVIMA